MWREQTTHVCTVDDGERAYLESLIRADYERCHPDETIEDIKRRARFSKEDKGLLRDWMAVAAKRAAGSGRLSRCGRIRCGAWYSPPFATVAHEAGRLQSSSE